MKTIIPNELSFNLDSNDLPTRASQVSSEALKITGREGGCWGRDGKLRVKRILGNGVGFIQDRKQPWKPCEPLCRTYKDADRYQYRPRGKKVYCTCIACV